MASLMFNIGEVETRLCSGVNHEKATNYLVQAQQCDLMAHLTEEMNNYPKGSPERELLKAVRFGVAYGKGDQTINLYTEHYPEEMMSRFKAVFKEETE